MGRPHSGTAGHPPIGGRPLRDRSRIRKIPAPIPPPPPPQIVQEFIGRLPTETVLIRLSRAAPDERANLAHRVIDRFTAPNGTYQPDVFTTVKTAETMFLSVIAIRAGIHRRGRNNEDEIVLRTMQGILVNCVTRENARDVATMMQTVRIDHIGGSPDDRRATARPVMSRVLAHGFKTVVPEIRVVDGGLLVIATVTRGDPATGWRTVSNMRVSTATVIPTGMLVLVPYPLPRPADVSPDSERRATVVHDERLVLVDPRLLPR